MLFAGLGPVGRTAMRLAGLFTPPYKSKQKLARYSKAGYIAATAAIHCPDLATGKSVFIGDRVTIYQAEDGGGVEIGDEAAIHQDTLIETGHGGDVSIGAHTHLQARVQISAYRGSVVIGRAAHIAPNCAFYPYDHGVAPDQPIYEQALTTKGGIVVGDDAWLGFGVIVLDGVHIGNGAVIGAGAVVTHDIPDNAIAIGSPARVVRMRGQPAENDSNE